MNNNIQPVVSVVIIVKNGEETLSQSIESVLNQSFQAFELIIVNDGSVDGTWELVCKYEEIDSRIIGVNLVRNIGRAGARNIGLDKASGKYIIYLDADDALPKDSIKSQVEIAASSNADIVYGRTRCFKAGMKDAAGAHYTDDIVCKTQNNITLDDHPILINNNQIVGRLYRLGFLRSKNIRFNEKRRSGEDLLFSFYTAHKAARISLAHNIFVYDYSIGNYIAKSSYEKIADARDALIEIANYMDRFSDAAAYLFLMRKFADYCTLLDRAEKVFGDCHIDFSRYLSSLRPLARRVSMDVVNELPQ
jgi:glycosyltransferase involved in cell wall biosynthesis